jgi:uncharacterized membrane protein YqjE
MLLERKMCAEFIDASFIVYEFACLLVVALSFLVSFNLWKHYRESPSRSAPFLLIFVAWFVIAYME